MHRFEIWAPKVQTLAVQVDGKTYAMNGPDAFGWWQAAVENAGAGSTYGYRLDEDKTVYPDPRSLWQPEGVHGASRVYDHQSFQWSDEAFQAPPLASAIVYELHVGTYTDEGTLDAAITKLDYLVDLGVTHVELLPVNAFSGQRGWGYDGVALFAVHEPYGGPEALKRFVNAAHGRGMAVLLDVVYNHFGPDGNYTGKYGPYIVESHHTPWGGAVNLEDAGAHEVRRFFCDNALMWLRDFHLDGLRLDAVHAFVDRSAIHFLEQLATEVEALQAATGRRLVLIAESDLNDPRVVTPREAGGFGIDAQWSDDFHHALFAALDPKKPEGYYVDFGKLEHLAKAMESVYVYDGQYSPFRDRVHGRRVEGLSRHRFLGYIQNHDQVGNRATGDRIHQIMGIARAKIAAALVLTGPFVPMLFQGEEWAASSPFQYFADHADPELARRVTEGRKREFAAFGWDPASIPDPESAESFERSKLNWGEVESAEHREMLAWYKALIQLRRSTPCLNQGEAGHCLVALDEEDRWLQLSRGEISVLANLSSTRLTFSAIDGGTLVLASADPAIESGMWTLPPHSVAIVRKPEERSYVDPPHQQSRGKRETIAH